MKTPLPGQLHYMYCMYVVLHYMYCVYRLYCVYCMYVITCLIHALHSRSPVACGCCRSSRRGWGSRGRGDR